MTLKLTPLGAFDLTSSVAVTSQMLEPLTAENGGTSSGMVEVLAQELSHISTNTTVRFRSNAFARTSLDGLAISLNAGIDILRALSMENV